jgi:hypothetical protein
MKKDEVKTSSDNNKKRNHCSGIASSLWLSLSRRRRVMSVLPAMFSGLPTQFGGLPTIAASMAGAGLRSARMPLRAFSKSSWPP